MNKTAWFWTIFSFVIAAVYLLTHDTLLVGGVTLIVSGIYVITDAVKHPVG